MASLFNVLINVGLVGLSLFIVLLVLMQRGAGMGGASLGAGAAESAFGGQANQVLIKTTAYAIIAFFALTFASYLLQLHRSDGYTERSALPKIRTQPSTPTQGSLTQVD